MKMILLVVMVQVMVSNNGKSNIYDSGTSASSINNSDNGYSSDSVKVGTVVIVIV